MRQIYDYIVVGAGSAGCVITRRLVDAGKRVLLLEAGAPDNTPFIKVPATFIRVLNTARTWGYQTTSQMAADQRSMFIPQGKTLGGSSSINAMIYIRGQPQDYDDWAAAGAMGWSWHDVLPVFKYSENNQIYANEWHGNHGLLSVSFTRYQHPLSQAFVRAAQQAGLPYNPDFNSGVQTGVGFYQTTTLNGERRSTAECYLRAVEHHTNLKIKTGVLVQKVLLEGQRAVGVSWLSHDGKVEQALAIEEVILSAGALASPKILLLSGIGDADELTKVGVALTHHLPGVGKNFQDHLEVPVYARVKKPISLLGNDKGWTAFKNAVQWKLFRTGMLTSNVVESGGFVDTTGDGRADIQFHILPVLVGDYDRKPIEGHGMSLNPCFLRPKSRGQLRLASNNPTDAVILDANFLDHPDDLETLLRGLKWARKILRSPELQAHISEELAPSGAAEISDDALRDWIRARCKTVYHPAGTCKMGMDDLAVVDVELKVHGIAGLRVADASIMPTLPSGNTNAPSIMIGERCAAFILKHTF